MVNSKKKHFDGSDAEWSNSRLTSMIPIYRYTIKTREESQKSHQKKYQETLRIKSRLFHRRKQKKRTQEKNEEMNKELEDNIFPDNSTKEIRNMSTRELKYRMTDGGRLAQLLEIDDGGEEETEDEDEEGEEEVEGEGRPIFYAFFTNGL
uniref:Uncharacterized protein n=1 Tax=Caenorhabditis tropicalis TaxID=1561998 RepID=A0A1I7UC69_9PELO